MTDLMENAEFTLAAEESVSDAPAEAIIKDPAPKRTTEKRKRSRRNSGASRSTASAAMKREARDFVQFSLEMAANIWGAADPVCSGVLARQAPEIAENAAEIMARYPGLLGKLDMPSLIQDWFKLGASVLPVLAIVRAHHGRGAEPAEGMESAETMGQYGGFAYAATA